MKVFIKLILSTKNGHIIDKHRTQNRSLYAKRIQSSMDTYIVVFASETSADVGTYQDPNHPAVGVHWLFVNGEVVVNNSELDTNVKYGQAIRRKA